MSCTTPLSQEQLVAYWANDLDGPAQDAIEEHLFACDRCSLESARVSKLVQAFRTGMQPVITHDELAQLRARGLAIEENTFLPGTRQAVTFTAGIDLMIHHLGGLDLAGAERVEVVVRNEAGDLVMFEEHFAPFDPARGEVLIACQRHFSVFPPDVVFDVRVHRPAAPPTVTTYSVPHRFAP
jgi:hypothetical protein